MWKAYYNRKLIAAFTNKSQAFEIMALWANHNLLKLDGLLYVLDEYGAKWAYNGEDWEIA